MDRQATWSHGHTDDSDVIRTVFIRAEASQGRRTRESSEPVPRFPRPCRLVKPLYREELCNVDRLVRMNLVRRRQNLLLPKDGTRKRKRYN